MIKTISGTLTIPLSEVNSGGVYTDLTLQLVHVIGGVESVEQTATVTTDNQYSFSYDNTGVDMVKVKLIRTSNGVLLSETKSRGVLPRSFLQPPADAFYVLTKNDNWLFDAGLSILATSGGNYQDLAKEITEGVIKAETNDGALPFQANHVVPTGSTKEFRTGTIAVVAYSLGYYLEKNPLASNRATVAKTLNNLLEWLCDQRSVDHGYLLIGGKGRMVNGTFDENFIDNTAYTTDNIMSYFAFKQAGVILNEVYNEVAAELATVIKSKLYDSNTRKFFKALLSGGTPNTTDELEANYMGSFFFIEEDDIEKAEYLMDNVEANFNAVDNINQVNAYKAVTTNTKVWFEGSYGVATAYYKLGDTNKYNKIVKSLNRLLNDDGSFRWGVIKDGQQKVLDYKSVGSTAWSFVSNMVPEEIFTINSNAEKVTGVVPVFINHAASGNFQKNDCVEGTGSTVSFKVLPGVFRSEVDQSTVDATAAAGVTSSKAIEVTDSVEGVIMKSPNGNRWRLTVNDSGVITTTLI